MLDQVLVLVPLELGGNDRVAALLQLLDIPELVLHHAQEGLEPRRLLSPQERLYDLADQVGCARDDQLL